MRSSKNDLGEKMEKHLDELVQALASADQEGRLKEFLEDLCTPAELRSMADRWLVAKYLQDGVPYRSIYDQTGVSTATITRVARAMSYGSGGYKAVLSQRKEAEY